MLSPGSMMTTKEDLVERIENILEADLDFLVKLAPRELGILVTSLKDLVERDTKSVVRADC